jgi:hypothetical protein
VSSWRLEGCDAFDHEFYSLDGEYESKESVELAAKTRLEELEKSQPTATSGGQGGLQDEVHIVRPDGTSYRYQG